MKPGVLPLAALVLAGWCAHAAERSAPALANGLRGPAPLEAEGAPPPFPKIVNDDQRRARAYPMQPPLIPHQIDNYQLDLSFNKCMSCHGRDRTGESQAPMVSVTHYLDRDGTMRNEISPRRYFCTQCHVVQTDAKLPVRNDFRDFYGVAGARKGAR